MRGPSEDEFAREIDAHVAIETDRLIADGLDPTKARANAVRRFGNRTVVMERFYESRRVLWLDVLRHDVHHASRSLARRPGVTIVAVLTLALGIGASTIVATAIDAVYLNGLPIADQSDLRTLSWTSYQRGFTRGLFKGPRWDALIGSGGHIDTFPVDVFRAIETRGDAFDAVACWRHATEALTDSGLLRVQAVTGRYFETLRLRPARGRTIGEADDRSGAPLVAMARDPEWLDRTIGIHGHAFTVVGILPKAFSGLDPMTPADLIVPYAADTLFPTFQRNDWTQCAIVARLKHGTAVDQARAQAEVIVQQEIQAVPVTDRYELPRVHLDELSVRFQELRRAMGTPLALLVATVGILLLITCVNLGGLLFARGRARQKELATRLAVGGSRRRIVGQLVTESLLLSAAGCAAGVLLAYAATPWLPRFLTALGGGSAIGVPVGVNLDVLVFAIAVSAACGVAVGLLPALQTTRLDPAAVLKQSSGVSPSGRARAGKAAVALQLSLSMVVMVAAGLLTRTMMNLEAVPLGYMPEGLVFVETNNPVGRPRAVVEETLADLQRLPGVAVASVSQWPLFNNTVLRFPFCVPGAEPAVQQLDLAYAFPRFFETWGVGLVMGRDLDAGTAPGVIVNETFVKRFLAGRDPLSERVGLGGCPGKTSAPIIGVAADHIDRQRVERVPAVYLRYPRAGALYVTTYAVRTQGDVRALVPAVRRVIALHGIAPTGDVRTGVEYRDGMVRQERLLTRAVVFFALVAFSISCLGIYGLLAYTVAWRTPEIALRMAVGASRSDVVRLIVRESLLPVGAGLAAGVVSALLSIRPLAALLFGVSSADPTTLAGAAAVIAAGAAVASWLPARRASAIDPATALRCE